MLRKIFLLIGTIVFLVSHKAYAGAMWATEITQILNNVELVAQVMEQIKTVEELVKQVEIMEGNTEPSEEFFFGNTFENIMELAEIVKAARVVAYSAANIEEEFIETYPGFVEHIGKELSDWDSENLVERWIMWEEGNRNNIQAALKAAGYHNEKFETEQELISELETAASTSTGRHKAIQTTNEIAVEQLKQLQKLRQMLQTQIQMHGNYMAYVTEKEADVEAYEYKMTQRLGEANQNIVVGNEEEY